MANKNLAEVKIVYNEQTYSKEDQIIVLSNEEKKQSVGLDWWINNNSKTIDPINHETFYDELETETVSMKTRYSPDNEHHHYNLGSDINFNSLNSPLTLAGLINKGMYFL